MINIVLGGEYEPIARLSYLGMALVFVLWSVLCFSVAVENKHPYCFGIPPWIVGIFCFLMSLKALATWVILVYVRNPDFLNLVETMRFFHIGTQVLALAVGLWMTSFYYLQVFRLARDAIKGLRNNNNGGID